MTKAQVETIKAFFSRPSDWLRPPYGRGMVDMKRPSVSIATTNASRYLKDPTGNRRWLPVACSLIDVEAIARDREQIFAEALAMYRAGRAWWIDDVSVIALAKEQTERRETVDPWEERLREWVESSPPSGSTQPRGMMGVTTADALAFLQVPIERQTDRRGRPRRHVPAAPRDDVQASARRQGREGSRGTGRRSTSARASSYGPTPMLRATTMRSSARSPSRGPTGPTLVRVPGRHGNTLFFPVGLPGPPKHVRTRDRGF